MKKFNVEILEVENGYVILEGIYQGQNSYERSKWVANSISDLAELVAELARKNLGKAMVSPPSEKEPGK